jgi:hypothetical protein
MDGDNNTIWRSPSTGQSAGQSPNIGLTVMAEMNQHKTALIEK